MNELIKVNFDTQTVSARELHKQVGSTERFSAWFERQLQYGFVENEDYTGCKKFNTLAKQELQDYELSVDMAKEICMVQKNENARKVRQYLIELEKAWNTPEQIMARALKMADKTIEQLKTDNKALEQKIEQDKPKTIFADAVSTSHTSILIGDLAKLICQNGVQIGQKRLFEWMRQNNFLIKSGSSRNMPMQRYVEQGLFEIKESNVQNPDGSVRITKTTKVTGKGQIYFVNQFLKGNTLEKRC
ncbi:phage antirepressor KilAC domain-containing protein [[Ruminococcus] torques]|jgi:anti-repressor protein|uniref:phage antirepressor KilAC domain-containing protein n=1 Tax=[Ruminococcus] torques TaxID=33039 RepID=UPI00399C0781